MEVLKEKPHFGAMVIFDTRVTYLINSEKNT